MTETDFSFWSNYGKVEKLLSTHFKTIEKMDVFCYVESVDHEPTLIINAWKEGYGSVFRKEIPYSVWLKQKPEITADQFLLEYTFL
jgi:hypothetical protein